MLDFNDRRYKKVAFFEPGEWVCFEMENGLAYTVLLKKNEIEWRVDADSILKFVDDVVPGDEISNDELQKAVAILETAPLPQYDNKNLEKLEDEVQLKLLEARQNALFRGKIKTLCLTTTPCLFGKPPEYGDDLEQCLTITANGNVKVSRKISGGWDSDKENQTVTEKVKISPEDAAKILNRISKYFAKEHEKFFATDIGIWDLKLINTDGEVFRFSETNRCSDHRSALSRVSMLIRKITGLEYVLGFDEDTQYGFLLLNKIDKDPADVIKLVKKEARKNEFNVIEYLGEFDGARVYSPILKKVMFTGMPEFILAKDGKVWLEISKYCLDILSAFIDDEKEK